MSKKNIFAILGVQTKEEVKSIFQYKLSPDQELSDCEVNMIINVCENYQINPNLGMLYLRRDNYNAIYPTLKVDGWYKLVNDQDDCMGFEFFESENKLNMATTFEGNAVNIFEFIGCKIYRKDRDITPLVKEYIVECFNKNNEAYFTHGNRLLRHASFIQAARIVYNLSGIYDPNEEINFVKDNNKLVEDVSSSDFDVIGDEAVTEEEKNALLDSDGVTDDEINLIDSKAVTDDEESALLDSDGVTDDEIEVIDSEEVTEDEIIATEPESVSEDKVIVTEPETVSEDKVIATESEAVTEDKVIATESEAVTENKEVSVNFASSIPNHEITQINGYIRRGKSMGKLSNCVVLLKQRYDESYYPYIDQQAKKVS